MNEIIRDYTLRSISVQRNIFLAITFILLLLTLILSLLLFSKSEKVIIVPSTVEKEFWVEGSLVSPTYLEQIGCFVGDLLLTRSPASAEMQLAILMRHTDPSFASTLRTKLSAEAAKLTKDNASYVFFRTKVVVDPYKSIVTLEGDRTLFLRDKILSTSRESYLLGFSNHNGCLLLTSVERGEVGR